MADGNNTPIVVAIIGAVATLGVGIVTNLDKFRSKPAPADTQTAAELAPAAAADAAPAGDVPDISGAWVTPEGELFEFAQSGTKFTYDHSVDGAKVSQGQGDLSDRLVTISYGRTDGGDQGICDGQVAADDSAITGICTTASNEKWEFRLERPPAEPAV
jgi:hypothetical protein